MTNPLPNHSEYKVEDALNRIDGFRRCIGWGQLNDDLQVAIDCMAYVRNSIRLAEKAREVTAPSKPHWIITSHGFAGQCYKCSACGERFWDVSCDELYECKHCHAPMDADSTEYSV